MSGGGLGLLGEERESGRGLLCGMARVARLELGARSWPGSGTWLSSLEVCVAACLLAMSLLTC